MAIPGVAIAAAAFGAIDTRFDQLNAKLHPLGQSFDNPPALMNDRFDGPNRRIGDNTGQIRIIRQDVNRLAEPTTSVETTIASARGPKPGDRHSQTRLGQSEPCSTATTSNSCGP